MFSRMFSPRRSYYLDRCFENALLGGGGVFSLASVFEAVMFWMPLGGRGG